MAGGVLRNPGWWGWWGTQKPHQAEEQHPADLMLSGCLLGKGLGKTWPLPLIGLPGWIGCRSWPVLGWSSSGTLKIWAPKSCLTPPRVLGNRTPSSLYAPLLSLLLEPPFLASGLLRLTWIFERRDQSVGRGKRISETNVSCLPRTLHLIVHQVLLGQLARRLPVVWDRGLCGPFRPRWGRCSQRERTPGADVQFNKHVLNTGPVLC